MMESIYKELKETLDGIKSPFEDESTGIALERKFSHREWDEEEEKEALKNKGIGFEENQKFEDIDVSYDSPLKTEGGAETGVEGGGMNINDEKVKDRWSRYIGAMGIEAVAKQAESRVLLMGLGPLGVEIAKNIVLAGCKELILYD